MAQDGEKGVTKAIKITLSLTVTVSIAVNFAFGFNLNSSQKTVAQLEREVTTMTENYNLLLQQITVNPTFNFNNSAAQTIPTTAPESAPVASQANVWVDVENNQLAFSGISPNYIGPIKQEPNNEYSQNFNFYYEGNNQYLEVTFDGATIKGIASEEADGELHQRELNGQAITVKMKSVAVFWKAPAVAN